MNLNPVYIVIFSAVAAGFSLILGTIIGTSFKIPEKAIAAIMAFGSGVLICALTFGLMEEAFRHGGWDAVLTGFMLGGLVFLVGDFLLHRIGGRNYKKGKSSAKKVSETNGKAIVLGALLDGIPESIALGVALLSRNGIGLLMVAAIFLSNLPESISSIDDLKKEGLNKRQIYWTWMIVSAGVISTTIITYFVIGRFEMTAGLQNSLGIIESFAAGAILAMLADSMMPEAYENGGYLIGGLTILGFLTAFILSKFAI